MPYDPNFPADDVLIESLPFRNQFHGIMDAVDAINAVNAATVDGVNTVNPGDPAQVLLDLVANTLRFTFAIPRGQDGATGGPGDTGPQGPPFANAIVDGVTTLSAGSMATVTVGFDGTNVHLTFGIPEGQPGIQGPPGEVTNADLSAAMDTTSSNSNAVATLGMTVSDPPTQGEMQSIVNKLDELIVALRN